MPQMKFVIQFRSPLLTLAPHPLSPTACARWLPLIRQNQAPAPTQHLREVVTDLSRLVAEFFLEIAPPILPGGSSGFPLSDLRPSRRAHLGRRVGADGVQDRSRRRASDPTLAQAARTLT